MNFMNRLKDFEYRTYSGNKKGMYGIIEILNHPVFKYASIVIDGKYEPNVLDWTAEFMGNEQCAARMIDKNFDLIIKETVNILKENNVTSLSALDKTLLFVFDGKQFYDGGYYNCSIYATEIVGSRRKVHHIMVAEISLGFDASVNAANGTVFGINHQKGSQYQMRSESYFMN